MTTAPLRAGGAVASGWRGSWRRTGLRVGWLYLAGLLDACTRKIVGWAANDTLPTSLFARAFKRAVTAQRPSPGLLYPSDCGSQYSSDAYRELPGRHDAAPSTSRAGNCYDNARMESFWATLKAEYFSAERPPTRHAAKLLIFDFFEGFYNRLRLHNSLGTNLLWRSRPTLNTAETNLQRKP